MNKVLSEGGQSGSDWEGVRLACRICAERHENPGVNQILEGSESQDGKLRLYLLGNEIPPKVYPGLGKAISQKGYPGGAAWCNLEGSRKR